jgi:molybdopterin converting factor small subunit
MSTITIHMKFFGSFRKFGESLDFSVPIGSTVAVIKSALQEKLNGEGLVLDSVLANDSNILRDSDVLGSDAKLSILPPVCGG